MSVCISLNYTISIPLQLNSAPQIIPLDIWNIFPEASTGVHIDPPTSFVRCSFLVISDDRECNYLAIFEHSYIRGARHYSLPHIHARPMVLS